MPVDKVAPLLSSMKDSVPQHGLLQHSQKFMKEVDPSEVRQTPVITGDSLDFAVLCAFRRLPHQKLA